jgi:periplasmic mercuric ion binding protein
MASSPANFSFLIEVAMNTHARRASVVALLLVTPLLLGADSAPLTVTISDMHLCCKGCTSAVEKAAAKVPGVKCKASQDDTNAVVVADDTKSMQQALDEIAAAGFFGTLDSKEVEFKPFKFAEGKVKRLEVAHIHNCCGHCTDSIKGAIEAVAGVTGNTVKNKQVSFIVEGDFAPEEVVKALQAAGFYPTIKGKDAKKP